MKELSSIIHCTTRMKSADVWKMWFIKWTVKVNGCSFQQVLRQNLGWFYFKANIKSIDSSKKRYQGFSKEPSVWETGVFLCDNHWKLKNIFNTLTLKQIFRKTKTIFKKLGYRFSVESTKIENASFLHKTAMSEANVKTNKMVTTKWTYHKERSFAGNYFIFWKFCFSKNLL